MDFRALKAEEIKARIDQVGDYQNGSGYCTLLLYIDARTAMDILDEACGNYWQIKHYEVKGNLYCALGIKIGEEWIWRDDCGTESYAEAEKGESSDSFKRACVMWGLGRELYTAPTMRITCKVEKNTKGKAVPTLCNFKVESVTIVDGTIKAVTIEAYDKSDKSYKQYSFGEIPAEPKKKKAVQSMTLEEAKDVVYKGKGGIDYKLGDLSKEELALIGEWTKAPELKKAIGVILNEDRD